MVAIGKTFCHVNALGGGFKVKPISFLKVVTEFFILLCVNINDENVSEFILHNQINRIYKTAAVNYK